MFTPPLNNPSATRVITLRNKPKTIMDKLSIRKEAARIAAQVEGVTTRNFTATARRIEHYITGSAKLPEQYNEEEKKRADIRLALRRMAEDEEVSQLIRDSKTNNESDFKKRTLFQDNTSKANDDSGLSKEYRQSQVNLAEANRYMEDIRKTQELRNHLNETAPYLPLSCLSDLYILISEIFFFRKRNPDPLTNSVNRHDPAFVSDLMKTFANYPATKEDFNQAVRRRHELYHDLGLEPEPFDKRHPHPPRDTGQETVYLAPGGMPSSEAESIYLQENGDKVE